MKKFKDIYNETIKPTVSISTDNFTSIIGEDSKDADILKINVEDDFIDDGILALYKVGASKYNLKFEIIDKALVNAHLSGTSINLIKFLLDIAEMIYSSIKYKYPKLNFDEYEKLNK